jgi:hypothetical protein
VVHFIQDQILPPADGASRWNDLKAGVATGKDSEKTAENTAEKTVQDTVRRIERVSKWDALRRGTDFIAETEKRSRSGSRRRRTRELATKLETASTGNEKQLEPKSKVGETNSSTDVEGSVLKTMDAEKGAQLVDRKTAFQLNDCHPSEQKVASSKSCDVESSMQGSNSSLSLRAIDATEIAETTKPLSLTSISSSWTTLNVGVASMGKKKVSAKGREESDNLEDGSGLQKPEKTPLSFGSSNTTGTKSFDAKTASKVKEAAGGSSGKKRASKWGMLKGGIGFINKTKKQAELKKDTVSQKIDIISEAQKHAAVFTKRPLPQVPVA